MNNKNILILGNGYFMYIFKKIQETNKEWKYFNIETFIKNKIKDKLYENPYKFLKDTGWIKDGENYIENYSILGYIISKKLVTKKYKKNDNIFKILEKILDKDISLKKVCKYLNSYRSFNKLIKKGTCKIVNNEIICQRNEKNMQDNNFNQEKLFFKPDIINKSYKSFYIWIIMYWIYENMFYMFDNKKIADKVFTEVRDIYRNSKKYQNIFSLNYFDITKAIFSCFDLNRKKYNLKIDQTIPNELKEDKDRKWSSVHIREKKEDTTKYEELAKFFDTLSYNSETTKKACVSGIVQLCHGLYSEKILISNKDKEIELYEKRINLYNDQYWNKIVNIDFFGINIEEMLLKFLCKKIKHVNNNNVVWRISYYCTCEHNDNLCTKKCNDYKMKQKWIKIIKTEMDNKKIFSKEYFKNNIKLIKSENFLI